MLLDVRLTWLCLFFQQDFRPQNRIHKPGDPDFTLTLTEDGEGGVWVGFQGFGVFVHVLWPCTSDMKHSHGAADQGSEYSKPPHKHRI